MKYKGMELNMDKKKQGAKSPTRFLCIQFHQFWPTPVGDLANTGW